MSELHIEGMQYAETLQPSPRPLLKSIGPYNLLASCSERALTPHLLDCSDGLYSGDNVSLLAGFDIDFT